MAKAATAGDTAKGDPAAQHSGTLSGNAATVSCTFSATIDQQVSNDVFFDGRKAATKDSTAAGSLTDTTPMPDSATPPQAQKGSINSGSETVFVNGVAAVRDGDGVTACDPTKTKGKVSVTQSSTVLIGD